jgi:hypothetical protein
MKNEAKNQAGIIAIYPQVNPRPEFQPAHAQPLLRSGKTQWQMNGK